MFKMHCWRYFEVSRLFTTLYLESQVCTPIANGENWKSAVSNEHAIYNDNYLHAVEHIDLSYAWRKGPKSRMEELPLSHAWRKCPKSRAEKLPSVTHAEITP